jgi:hypothetical protein
MWSVLVSSWRDQGLVAGCKWKAKGMVHLNALPQGVLQLYETPSKFHLLYTNFCLMEICLAAGGQGECASIAQDEDFRGIANGKLEDNNNDAEDHLGVTTSKATPDVQLHVQKKNFLATQMLIPQLPAGGTQLLSYTTRH